MLMLMLMLNRFNLYAYKMDWTNDYDLKTNGQADKTNGMQTRTRKRTMRQINPFICKAIYHISIACFLFLLLCIVLLFFLSYALAKHLLYMQIITPVLYQTTTFASHVHTCNLATTCIYTLPVLRFNLFIYLLHLNDSTVLITLYTALLVFWFTCFYIPVSKIPVHSVIEAFSIYRFAILEKYLQYSDFIWAEVQARRYCPLFYDDYRLYIPLACCVMLLNHLSNISLLASAIWHAIGRIHLVLANFSLHVYIIKYLPFCMMLKNVIYVLYMCFYFIFPIYQCAHLKYDNPISFSCHLITSYSKIKPQMLPCHTNTMPPMLPFRHSDINTPILPKAHLCLFTLQVCKNHYYVDFYCCNYYRFYNNYCYYYYCCCYYYYNYHYHSYHFYFYYHNYYYCRLELGSLYISFCIKLLLGQWI